MLPRENPALCLRPCPDTTATAILLRLKNRWTMKKKIRLKNLRRRLNRMSPSRRNHPRKPMKQKSKKQKSKI
jgi:hypothetical protein